MDTTAPQSQPLSVYVPDAGADADSNLQWFAIRTRSRAEKATEYAMQSKGYEPYLPMCKNRRQWSDRKVEIEIPLFAGYLFCRFDPLRRLPILTTPGVVSILGNGKVPIPIPDQEIEAIQIAVRTGLAEPWPYLKEGDKIRVTRGSMMGIEGLLVKKKANWRIVVSLALLQRSVAVEIDADSVTAIK
jgi:transcription antitermination factor NusG